MDITLYNCTAEPNMLDKSGSLTGVASYTGAVARHNVDMISPEITLEESVANIVSANYCYISDFGRYYQIVEKSCDVNGLWKLSLKEDVLMSFKDSILSLSGIVARQHYNYDMYLPDNLIPSSIKKNVNLYKFGSTPFTGSNNLITLIVLGGK